MGCDGARSRRGPRRRAFPPVAAGPFVRANGAQRRFKTRRPPCWPGSDAASRESSENDRSHARHSSPNCHPKRSTRPGERRRPPSLSLVERLAVSQCVRRYVQCRPLAACTPRRDTRHPRRRAPVRGPCCRPPLLVPRDSPANRLTERFAPVCRQRLAARETEPPPWPC